MVIGAIFGALTARGLAQGLIQSGITRGLSANLIQNMLQKAGLGYRRTNILSDVRFWNEAFARGDRMKFTTMDARLGANRYMETDWRMGSRYETLFRTDMKDPLTGEVTREYVTVTHTHLENGIEVNDLSQTKTRQELQEAAEEDFEQRSPGGKKIVGPVVPIMGFFNPDIF